MFIDDSTGTLSATDKSNLEGSAPARMDVKIIVASSGSRAELDAAVGRLVNSANTLAIGIDPVHRYTFTHFGSALGVPTSEMQAVARSGNADFKVGHWAEGLRAIMASASLAQRTTSSGPAAVIVQQPTTVVEHPVSAAPFVIGALVTGALLVALVLWLRRRSRAEEQERAAFREEAAQMRTRNVEEQGWHDRMKERQQSARRAPGPAPVARAPSPVQAPASMPGRRTVIRERVIERPAPAPVVVQQSGGNDLLTGVLIGEAIARPAPVVEHHHHRHRTPTPAPAPSSSSSSWDSGGSSSSWDSGSGGGGYDSGGGGFDGGSGGGDF